MRPIIERHLSAILVTPETRRDRSRLLRQLADVSPPHITQLQARHIVTYLGADRYSPQHVYLRLSTARVFCRWCVINGHLRKDPTLGLRATVPTPIPKALPHGDVVNFLGGISDLRTRAIAFLMTSECLRRVEVARAQLGDYDKRQRTIAVRGKGYKNGISRVLPIAEVSARALDAYLAAEHITGAGPLFRSRNPGRTSRGLTPGTCGALVRDAMTELGLKHAAGDGWHPHALRHTGATDALEAGVSLPVLQRFLGHASPVTTHHYTRGAAMDLAAAHTGRSYVA